MRKALTAQDIKDLKYQCRMGYIIPFFFFVLGTLIVSTIIYYLFNQESEGLNNYHMLLVFVAMFILSIFINFKMNGKYISDIKNYEKIIETKTIQRKESKNDVEAGSGNMTTRPHNNPMKEFKRYDLIIENTRYRIDKELFENCEDGGEVYFHIAPKSKFRLRIEAKGDARP